MTESESPTGIFYEWAGTGVLDSMESMSQTTKAKGLSYDSTPARQAVCQTEYAQFVYQMHIICEVKPPNNI